MASSCVNHNLTLDVTSDRLSNEASTASWIAECTVHTAFNPLLGRFVPGQSFGRGEYLKHRRLVAAMQSSPSSSSDKVSSPSDKHSRERPSTIKNGRSRPPLSPSTTTTHPTRRLGRSLTPRVRSTVDSVYLQKLKSTREELEAQKLALSFFQPCDLIFLHPPRIVPTSAPISSSHSTGEVNAGPYALEYNRSANREVLQYELWLVKALESVDSISAQDRPRVLPVKKLLVAELLSELERLEHLKLSEWQRRNGLHHRAREYIEAGKAIVIDTAIYNVRPLVAEDPIILTVYLTVAALHLLCHLSLDHCTLLLYGLNALLRVLDSCFTNGNLKLSIRDGLPYDAREIVDSLHLKPTSQAYCCCPKCFKCYDLDVYPDHCNGQDAPDGPICGRALRHQVFRLGTSKTYASRRYLYHDFKHWMARLLSRPGLEEYLDRDVFEASASGSMKDIWDGEVLPNFQGPDGSRFIRKIKGREGRYVFGLNMDGFNPFGNKIAGKTSSTGAIYMVCLNLPPELRYRVENIFLVSIIPGPKHPSLVQINHLLRPLVDDLLRFWYDGVFYLRTAKYTSGRLVRCALVPVVCDLPAARQMMPFASYSLKNFCCYCGLKKEDIDNLDMSTWPPALDRERYVAIAEEWKNSVSSRRDELFEEHGVRYSELLRLPYWDPTRFVVIDSMHALFLTALKHHCRDLWGMNIGSADGDGLRTYKKHSKEPDDGIMAKAWELVRRGTAVVLEKFTVIVLRRLCHDVHLPTGGMKKKLLDQLLAYRKQRGWVNDAGAPVDPLPQKAKPGKNDEVDHVELHAASGIFKNATSVNAAERKIRRKALDKIAEGLASVDEIFSAQVTGAKLNKFELLEHMMSARNRLQGGLVQPHANAVPLKLKQGPILGRARLAEVQKDISNMTLPSWIGRVPTNFGCASHGSLSADQWRTACTVYLVTTLVRLWGNCPTGSRELRMLHNFIELVYATKYGTMRTLTPHRIQQFHAHIAQYLKGIVELYPDSSLLPYHHLLLHFSQFLKNFGPTHGWRCFPFERYNHVLQQVKTNRKFGELEITMFETFCASQNLRAFMQGSELHGGLRWLRKGFHKIFQDDTRGSLMNDIWAFGDDRITFSNKTRLSTLDKSTSALLQDYLGLGKALLKSPMQSYQSVLVQGSISVRGVKFSTWKTSLGDSQVVFGDYPYGKWFAGRIADIFVLPNTPKSKPRSFLVVHCFLPLSPKEAKYDKYRQFTDVGGQLVHAVYASNPVLLSPDEVICHFASAPHLSDNASPSFLHVLPLNRD